MIYVAITCGLITYGMIAKLIIDGEREYEQEMKKMDMAEYMRKETEMIYVAITCGLITYGMIAKLIIDGEREYEQEMKKMDMAEYMRTETERIIKRVSKASGIR